jgi:glucitol operon activator protein
MGSWQGILALLAIAWALQCAGTLVQVRRYRDAFRELSNGWSDGWMGAGKGGSAWRGAALAMVVVGPDERVRRAVTIRGRTVFARAERLSHLEGMTTATLRETAGQAPRDAVQAALLSALDQIATVRAAQEARAETSAHVSHSENWADAPA